MFLLLLRMRSITVYSNLLSDNWNQANYMLIFQLHLPHIIPNSMRPLHDLVNSSSEVAGSELTDKHFIGMSEIALLW